MHCAEGDPQIGGHRNARTGNGILYHCGTTSSRNTRIFPTSRRGHRQGCVRRRPPRRDHRGGESGAHREVAHRRHGWERPIPDRRSGTGHIQRDVHAARIRHDQARGHRADGRRRDDDQCRLASRSGRRDRHRHRSDTCRRHADEHETRGRTLQRGARRGPGHADLRQHPGTGARRPVVDPRRELHPVDDRDRHEFLLHVAGRTRPGRHGPDRRHERRVGVRRRRRLELCLRFRERSGGSGDRRGRHGRE